MIDLRKEAMTFDDYEFRIDEYDNLTMDPLDYDLGEMGMPRLSAIEFARAILKAYGENK